MNTGTPLLAIDRLSIEFGGLQALWNVSFEVYPGEILSLIGPNGAGKTTLLNIVAGALTPTHGSVTLRGAEIQGRPAHEINRLGIGRTFQAAEIFGQLTVRENVMAGGVRGSDIGFLSGFNRWGRARSTGDALAVSADEALEFVGLGGQGNEPAANLPAGRQRLLGIARAMATGADLLLLDEPGAGLNASEKTFLIDVIRKLSASGRTIVLVEHDMDVVGELSDRIVVLEQGKRIAAGRPDEVKADPRVIEAYLGHGGVKRDVAPVREKASARGGDATELLGVSDLSVHYGGVIALDGVSLSVRKGEIVAILGANGAGKSTLLKSIAGIVKPVAGDVRFDGRSILRLSPDQIVQLGMSLTPEGRELFPSLSVADNLAMGRYAALKSAGGFLNLLFPRKTHQDALAARAKMAHALFPVLKERSDQLAGTLSGGQGQMLAIARSLMSEPVLLMLDEPSLGLAPMIVEEIMRTLARLRDQGVTILLVEQNASAALAIADRGYVLSTGSVVADGDAVELLSNTDITEAYLGGAGRRAGSTNPADAKTAKGVAAQ